MSSGIKPDSKLVSEAAAFLNASKPQKPVNLGELARTVERIPGADATAGKIESAQDMDAVAQALESLKVPNSEFENVKSQLQEGVKRRRSSATTTTPPAMPAETLNISVTPPASALPSPQRRSSVVSALQAMPTVKPGTLAASDQVDARLKLVKENAEVFQELAAPLHRAVLAKAKTRKAETTPEGEVRRSSSDNAGPGLIAALQGELSKVTYEEALCACKLVDRASTDDKPIKALLKKAAAEHGDSKEPIGRDEARGWVLAMDEKDRDALGHRVRTYKSVIEQEAVRLQKSPFAKAEHETSQWLKSRANIAQTYVLGFDVTAVAKNELRVAAGVAAAFLKDPDYIFAPKGKGELDDGTIDI